MADAHADPALLLRDFVNTLNIDAGTEGLATPADLAGWLEESALVPSGTVASDGDLGVAIALREGLRTAMLGHHRGAAADGTGVPELPGELEDALGVLPLRVTLAAGPRPALRPAAAPDTAAAGLARVAAAIADASADGTWPRLKVCHEDTCLWAFLDTSKNRSRAWCTMSTCGNRTKTRAYRARRRASASGPGAGSP
ncbi:CGNR zinc finger domain-containing protein [Actinomadura algeriensis]|uniref:RNA-binding Zn ribbon-like protein n=1 Tax=Actinomadura algeriensis TaxID=1679523 RepID=A0ABR9JWF9_9ACTN|nr:CGNR zinc finger domain-containing protein [Actinomadura algeriensis]MBE1534902.1 putative RNA-binding Zn ribbon-like protein [Actinomadura algeriensis]